MAKIIDFESAELYLKGKSPELRYLLSSRSELRVLGGIGTSGSQHFLALALSGLRASLALACRGLGREADEVWLGDAYISAGSSFLRIQASVASAAISTATAAISSSGLTDVTADTTDLTIGQSERSATYAALSSDTEAPSFAAPLWPEGLAPPEVLDNHAVFLTRLRETGMLWLPDWYEAMWHGTFEDWDFALAVAKIDNDVWEAGLDAVNEAIRALQAARLSDSLTQAEEITTDENGDFIAVPVLVDPHAIVVTTLSELGFLLEEAVKSNQCDLSHLCLAYKLLERTQRLSPDDPAAIEQNFRRARGIIQRKLERGEYLRDDVIEALLDTLGEGVMNMRATHPLLQDLFEKRAALALKTLKDAPRARLAEDFDGLAAEGTAGALQEDFALGAEVIRSEPDSDAERATVEQGGFRAAEIAKQASKQAKTLEGSGGMSAAKIGLRAQSIVDLIMSLF